METLETDRLIIRKLVYDDREEVANLLSEKFDYFNGPDLENDSTDRRLDWIVSLSNWNTAGGYYGDRGVVVKETNTLVGLCGIDPWLWKAKTKNRVPALFTDGPNDRECTSIEFELGYALDAEFRGQGYATEASLGVIDWAFQDGRVYRILARTSLENAASIKMMERIGMEVCRNDDWGGAAGIIRNPDRETL